MKSILGLAQLGLGAWGVFALINGQWLTVLAAWSVAGLLGLVGNRLTRTVEGVSESGREALASIPRAVELLRDNDYRQALGVTRAVVRSFRLGGDKGLLAMALPIHAVALAANDDPFSAKQALNEIEGLLRYVPAEMGDEVVAIRRLTRWLETELKERPYETSNLVSGFLRWNDSPSWK